MKLVSKYFDLRDDHIQIERLIFYDIWLFFKGIIN